MRLKSDSFWVSYSHSLEKSAEDDAVAAAASAVAEEMNYTTEKEEDEWMIRDRGTFASLPDASAPGSGSDGSRSASAPIRATSRCKSRP